MEPLQPRLFHDVITDAMHTDIAACGGAEKAAEWMLPHLGPKAGGDMVRAFVNPDRRERMTPEQLLLLMDLVIASSHDVPRAGEEAA